MDRSYVLRRVDTLAIVDRSIQQQRITLDIDRCALEAAGGPPRQQVIQPTRSTLSQAQKNCRNPFIILCKLLSPESSSSTDVMPENHSPRCMTHLEMRLPIMMLKKALFFDVDVKNSQGCPLHISRRSSNIDYSAHLIVGAYFNIPGAKTSPEVSSDIYEQATEYLHGENSSRLSIIRLVSKNGINQELPEYKDFLKILSRLQSLYIQCIELSNTSEKIEIVKLRISNTLHRFSSLRRPVSTVKESVSNRLRRPRTRR